MPLIVEGRGILGPALFTGFNHDRGRVQGRGVSQPVRGDIGWNSQESVQWENANPRIDIGGATSF